jgi:hypothetical protein
MSEDKFQISLLANGEHSLKKSLESYSEFERTKDQMLLKDTIMFLHQSIELLMKEMLVRKSPYLIFEDLKDISKKQKEANDKKLPIFFIEHPPKSVTYTEAINRVEAFINPPELDKSLKDDLDWLNKQRNQLEHYAIDADREEIVRILELIHKPILKLFENHLEILTQIQTPEVNQTWKSINNRYESYKQKKHEVFLLIKKFNSQKVPGRLFSMTGEIILPKFDNVFEDIRMTAEKDSRDVPLEVDIFAHNDDSSEIRWIVETKLSGSGLDGIYQASASAQLLKAVPWLVIFDKVPSSTLAKAEALNVMVTGSQEFTELKQLIESA